MITEEQLIEIAVACGHPVRSCVDLSKSMLGKKGCFIYFTQSFRLDFENKMHQLGYLEEKIKSKERIIEAQAEHIRYLKEHIKELGGEV